MSSDDQGIIAPDLVSLDVNLGGDKLAVIDALAKRIAATGRADAAGLAADARAREAQGATGMGMGIAIPHCRSESVKVPSLAFARLSEPVDFNGPDGDPADLVFMIAAPAGENDLHLKVLAKLAGQLVHPEFLAGLRSAPTPQAVVDLVNAAVSDAPDPNASAAAAAPAASGPRRTIVAVTSCPTGIAHTYMAADALKLAATNRSDVDVYVEPQGSAGYEPLDPALIANADAVIFATDVGVRGRGRFAGKPGVETGVKAPISDANGLIDEALAQIDDPKGHRISGGGDTSGSDDDSSGAGGVGWGKRIQQALMTGVSYMIPFVAAGGLLMALAFLLGGYDITNSAKDIVAGNTLGNLPDGGLVQYIAAIFATVGSAALGVFIVPALSGYIAYALGGRPGIAPGFLGGWIAVQLGAGFLGGLVTGLLAGLIAYWFTKLRPPRWLQGLMPVLIIPLVTTIVVALLMYLLLGGPIAALMTLLTDWLSGMSGGSAIVLGIVLGLMMCFDLGGPVNKVAYLFATAGLSDPTQGSLMIMAAVMASGMVPPLALALSTALRPKLYSDSERENGRAAWLLGASFISEGAIPFAAADPLRVIPSMMLGGAVTGALSMAFGVTQRAPHGGIFVFFAIDPIWGFVVAVVAGTLVAALAVTVLKSIGAKKKQQAAVVAG